MLDTISRQPIEPVNRPNPDSPNQAVEKFADLAFPMWKLACRGDPQAIGNLQWIIAKRVANIQTLDIIRNVYTPVLPRRRGDGIYRMRLSPNDMAFRAVLETPVAQDMANIAFSHHTSLGQKTVVRIHLYFASSIDSCYLALKLGYDRARIQQMGMEPNYRPRFWPRNWRTT